MKIWGFDSGGLMEGREVVSLGGVGHRELSEGFFGLTYPMARFGTLPSPCLHASKHTT